MFHLHIQGTGFENYWDLPKARRKEKELMGIWYGQLIKKLRLTLLFKG